MINIQTSQRSVRVSQPSSDQPHHRPPSVLQYTTKTEAIHKTTQSSLTTSISDDPTHDQEAATDKPDIYEKSSRNIWSVINSVDDESSMFGMPSERSTEEKKADSLQLVMELIEKVNARHSDFASADSKALRRIHTELTKVSQLVRNFLEYSTSLINDEGM